MSLALSELFLLGLNIAYRTVSLRPDEAILYVDKEPLKVLCKTLQLKSAFRKVVESRLARKLFSTPSTLELLGHVDMDFGSDGDLLKLKMFMFLLASFQKCVLFQ